MKTRAAEERRPVLIKQRVFKAMISPATKDRPETETTVESGKLRIEHLLTSIGVRKTLAAEHHRRDLMAEAVAQADCEIVR